MNRAFSKILILVILVILIGGGIFTWQYFGTPEEEVKTPEEMTEDETANWKIYRNEEYGFEIKYPLEIWPYDKEGVKLTFSPIEGIKDYVVVIQESHFAELKNTYSPFPFYGGLGIKVIKSPQKDPVEELKEEMQASHLSEEYIAQKIQEVIIGKNISATKVDLSNNKFEGYNFYIKKEGDIIVISFDSPGKIYYLEMFDQILSTFRFLE